MDKALWAHNNGAAASELAGWLGLTTDQASYVYQDIENKRKTTRYLHAKPYLIEEIKELDL
jgi:NAD+ synthase